MSSAATRTSIGVPFHIRMFAAIGRFGMFVGVHAGQMGTLAGSSLRALLRFRVSFREIIRQCYIMGVQSIPIALVTALLAGVVTSQQGGYQFTGSIPLYILGSVVTESMVLEMGPVLVSIIIVGRVGARITAEIGTMNVTEQIDAFHALGRDPVEILAAPRIIAGMITLPLLVGIANLIGIYAGMISAQFTLGLGQEQFFFGARLFWHNWDMVYSLTKALTYGFCIPFIALHMGFRTTGGAAGVGRATTSSVMFQILTILTLDAMFPPLLLQ